MGNFNYVTMGSGVLKWDGVDIGFLKGNVTFKYESEIYEFESGIPKTRQGIIYLKNNCSLQAPAAEIKAENMEIALAGLAPRTVAGTIVDKTGSFEALTCVDLAWLPGHQGIKLGATANMPAFVVISSGDDAPMIKNSTEDVTYIAGTDYEVDYDSGWVVILAGGSISIDEVLHVKYKYTPYASKYIDLGKAFTTTTGAMQFTHTNPNTQKTITVYFWKAQAVPTFSMEFGEDNPVLINLDIKALDDSTNHPDNPMGYIEFEE